MSNDRMHDLDASNRALWAEVKAVRAENDRLHAELAETRSENDELCAMSLEFQAALAAIARVRELCEADIACPNECGGQVWTDTCTCDRWSFEDSAGTVPALRVLQALDGAE